MVEELPSVFLVGPMGAGKTTIGRLLAKQLGRAFVDSDWYIESQTGADIAWIFAKEGEAGFRERETRAIDELTQKANCIGDWWRRSDVLTTVSSCSNAV